MWSARCLLFMRQTGVQFRGVRILILAVSQLCLPCFSTDRHKNSNRFKIILHLTLSRVSTKPEIEIDFRDVQNPILSGSRLWWTYFPTDRRKNPTRVKTLTLYSVVKETGHTIRILERCKFRFRFHSFLNDYTCNSLRDITKFCAQLRNVVG